MTVMVNLQIGILAYFPSSVSIRKEQTLFVKPRFIQRKHVAFGISRSTYIRVSDRGMERERKKIEREER